MITSYVSVIGSNYRTIPIAVQYLQGGYGSKDMGYDAMLVLAIIPIVIFYLTMQRYIIEGVVAERLRVNLQSGSGILNKAVRAEF